MTRATAPFHVDRTRYHLTLDAVPAWVCGQCGEAHFAENEVLAIQDIIRAIENRTDKLAVSA
jgi:YgiT-type zinc finger domain-containing protein